MKSSTAGDLSAGIGAGLAFLPLIVAVGFIAFGVLGPSVAGAMSVVIFATTLVGGVLVTVLARCPMLIGVTSGSSALVIAGLFAEMVNHGSAPGIAEAMAITLLISAVVAVVQFALVLAGAAYLGPLAPYPVVAGLVNGTAALVLLSQVPPLRAQPVEIMVALVTSATMLWFPAGWKVPTVLPAVAAGALAHAALNAMGVTAGPMLPPMPSPTAWPAMAADAFTSLGARPGELPWRAILTAGATIAILGVLESLAALSALSDAGVRTGEKRDLGAVAFSNLVVAATAGGPPISATVGGSMGLLRMGGTTRLAPVARLVTLVIGGVFLGHYLPVIPQGALVGLVLALGIRLFDPEPARLLWRAARDGGPHRTEIAGSAVTSLVVVLVAVFAGLAVAVAVGAVACLLLFTAAMAGSAVRRVYDGAATLSRVRRGTEETAILLRDRNRVAVLELAGPLFFGNVSPLGHALDEASSTGARHVVIDLSRVVRVDLSGARRLMSIVRQRRAGGLQVVLAPVRTGHPVADYLGALGQAPGECFAEITDALAAAEAAILRDANVAPTEFATAEEVFVALNVPVEHVRTLAARAETRDLAAGETLCRAGETADAIYVLMRGQADVMLARSTDSPVAVAQDRVVLAHLLAGSVIGERALFEAGTRSADVICSVDSRVMILTGPVLASISREASAASLALVLAITRHVSISLQLANAAIQRLEV